MISHEIGHLSATTTPTTLDDVINLMDSGGRTIDNLYGVGPDRIGGTADDSDNDFVTDTYSPAEGFGGVGEHPERLGVGVREGEEIRFFADGWPLIDGRVNHSSRLSAKPE